MEKLPQDTVDNLYYEVATPDSVPEKIMIAARDAMCRLYFENFGASPDDRIIDIGVSDVITGGDNIIERRHPFPATITAVGLGHGEAFCKAFPSVEYLQIETGTSLPFADRHFTTAVSNAVLEHVGSDEEQEKFVAEMVRVSERVFLTVPNRYFFVEHHTLLPLLHWMDWSFRLGCKVFNKDKWMDRSVLILMTKSRLETIARRIKTPVEWSIGYTGLAAGPFSSNLFLIIKRRSLD